MREKERVSKMGVRVSGIVLVRLECLLLFVVVCCCLLLFVVV